MCNELTVIYRLGSTDVDSKMNKASQTLEGVLNIIIKRVYWNEWRRKKNVFLRDTIDDIETAMNTDQLWCLVTSPLLMPHTTACDCVSSFIDAVMTASRKIAQICDRSGSSCRVQWTETEPSACVYTLAPHAHTSSISLVHFCSNYDDRYRTTAVCR